MANGDSIDTTYDLFMHDLRSLYYLERRLEEELRNMAEEVTKDDLSDAFIEHQEETAEQVRRLNNVFEHLDENAEEHVHASLSGLFEDVDHLNDSITETDMLNIAFLNSGIKVERIEITMYEGLLRLTDELVIDEEVEDLLEENLEEEKEALKKLRAQAQKSWLQELIVKFMS